MKESRSGIVTATIVGLALIICTILLANAFVRGRSGEEIIRVTGSARKPIRSDFIIWRGSVAYRAPTIDAAYQSVTGGVAKVKAYLISKGVPENEIADAAIVTKTLFARAKGDTGGDENSYRTVEGYELTQTVEVRSSNVALVDSLSRKSTELISSGVAFQSEAPQYFYTKLADLKISMLAEAAKDARTRAEQIAKSSGATLGGVRFARMGVLNISPAYTTIEASDYGNNDTSALDKEITAVVTMGYAIQ